jgi:hypothetical protein
MTVTFMALLEWASRASQLTDRKLLDVADELARTGALAISS